MPASCEDCRLSSGTAPRRQLVNGPCYLSRNLSTDLLEELTDLDIRILKCPFERIPIDFIVERKHNPSSVRVFHFDVATLAMNLYETEALQGCEHFPTR